MVVVLLYEKIVVLLNYQVFMVNYLCLLYPSEQLVVNLRSLIDEPQLCLVAVDHLGIQLPLYQEGDDEPIDPNKAVYMVFSEQKNDRNHDGKRGLNYKVHILEHVENQFQVNILQLHDL